MSNPNPPAVLAPAPRWFGWLGLVALAAYGIFLAVNASVVAGGADSSGYLNSAKLLAAGHRTAELRTPPEFGPQAELLRAQFQPHGFMAFPDHPRLSPTYAPGLPLHLALAGKIFGWSAGPLLVELAAALGAVWLGYAVARELGLDWPLAAAGAVALAACPVFIFTSIQPLSDTLATTWCLAAVFAALRARRQRSWAIACGVAFAIAVLVRATNGVILPALVVLLGFDWRRLALAVLGGLPGALWLASYNRALYGGAFRSGYFNISEAFAAAYGAPTLQHFAHWLALFLPAVLLVLPCGALLRRDARTRALLGVALWFGAIVGVYAFYEFSHEVWWSLRFILPAVPALILAALLGVDALSRRFDEKLRAEFCTVGAVVIGVWAIAGSVYWTRDLHVFLTKVYEQAYADAAAAAQAKFPREALLVCGQFSGAAYYYTDFPVMRWEFLNGGEFAHFAALAQKAGRPVVAVLHASEQASAFQTHAPGNWTRVATVEKFTLWRFNP